MSSLQVTELSCPSCGAPLRFSTRRVLSTCPFCDSQIAAKWASDNSRAVSIGDALPSAVVPSTVQREAFEEALLDWLAAGPYTPDDILSRALVQEHRCLLVPFYRVEGSWKATFTAAAGFRRTESYVDHETRHKPDGTTERVRVTKTRQTTDWRPMSGEASGDFQIMVPASEQVPDGLRDFCTETASGTPSAEEMTAAHLDDAIAEPFTQPVSVLWDEHGAPQLDRVVTAEIEGRIPGDRSRNIRYDLERTDKHVTEWHQPFWLAAYRYDDTLYHFIVDGTDVSRSSGRRPSDEDRVQAVKALFKPTWRWAKIWAVIFVVGLLLVVPAFVAVFVGLPHVIYLYVQADREKTVMLLASQTLRQKVLAEVKQRRGLGGG